MTDNRGTTLQGYLPFPEVIILERLNVLILNVTCKIHTTVISHMTWAGGSTCRGLSQGWESRGGLRKSSKERLRATVMRSQVLDVSLGGTLLHFTDGESEAQRGCAMQHSFAQIVNQG